ncbi:MAG: insulinase family protein [Deltaproteobacteria bacterium]|nr:insulinase family protein [Deltaproteobacteria bacterium]
MKPTITRHTLPNGLTVLLEENRSAPVISLNLLVKVGSAMETAPEAGICHFIEHMLFKGTPTRPVGRIARDVEAAGGEINAYTSFDHTVYYINMASRYADEGLKILADAVQHPLFDAREVEREAEVICEEIRRGLDNPQHVLMEHLFAGAYGTHPYGRPIIGSAVTVKSFQHTDLRHFWQRWYTASQMAVVVVGDFETTQLLRRIEEEFCDLSTTPAPVMPDLLTLNDTIGPQCLTERLNIQTSYFALAVPTPEITAAAVPALDILSHLLGGGESSRLEQIVKERKRLVQSIYTYAFTARGLGLFVIGGSATSAQMKRALPAIWDVVGDVLRPGAISMAELERAKLNIQCSEIYERETVGGQAGKHAYFLSTANDHQFERKYYDAVARTTLEQLHDTAHTYLRPDRSTLMWVAPKRDKIVPATQAAAWCRLPAPRPVTTVPGPRAVARPVLLKFPNGLRCVVRPEHRLPLVSIQAVMHGGTRYETAAINGINALLTNTLTKGTRSRDAATVAETIDAIGGGLNAGAGRNSVAIRSEFLSAKLTEGFTLFAETLREPAFAPEEVAKERNLLLEAIRNQEDNLPGLAMKHFCRALYGKHPYALAAIGEKESVRRLGPAQLTRYYEMIAHPSQIVLGVSGDIEPAFVEELVRRHIWWPARRLAARPKLPKLAAVKPQTVTTRRAEKQQAHIFYGVRGTTVTAPDRYAFSVLNQILSGQGGRLFLTLRDQMSLAYSVSASLQLGIEPGYFAVYIGTEPAKVHTAIEGIEQQLRQLTDEPVTDEEFSRAREHLVGTYELDLQRNSAIAGMHALNLLYGLGLDELARYPAKILAVTPRDLLRVAKKYFRKDAVVCSIVTP